jgi:hypothetical protein
MNKLSNDVRFRPQGKILPDSMKLGAFCFLHNDVFRPDRILIGSTPSKNFRGLVYLVRFERIP